MKVLANNKNAGFQYFLETFYECGMVLEGWEVEGILAGKLSLNEAYVRVLGEEVFLVGCTITPVGKNTSFTAVDPMRSRKLLLNKSEISKLIGKTQISGFTLVPVKVYYKNRRIKMEIALAKGKKLQDKREAKKTKDVERELRRTVKNVVR